MFKKNLLKVAFAFAMFLSLSSSVFAIDIYYKNAIVPTDSAPVIENGSTLVPISSIAKSMGAQVTWNAATKTATIKKDTVTIELVLGSTAVSIDKAGQKSALKLDVPAKSINGRTMVPVRAISEIFGNKVEWDKDTSSVLIDSDKPKSSNSNSAIEKAILNGIKDYSMIFYSIDSVDELTVKIRQGQDLGIMSASMAELKAKVPGNYTAFSLDGESGSVLGFINNANNKIYILNSGVVFSIPDYEVIIPPFDVEPGDDYSAEYDVFIRAIVRKEKIANHDEFKVQGQYDAKTQIYKVDVLEITSQGDKLIANYLVDRKAKTVTNTKTNKVVYGKAQSNNQNTTVEPLTQGNAGQRVMSALQSKKIINQDTTYIVTDVISEKVNNQDGFRVTVRLDGEVRAELVGHYFIDKQGNIMEYDVVSDSYGDI